jgi:hypothetical protein
MWLGSEGREFIILTAWCTKQSLVEQLWRILYLLLEGRRLNRLCAGWLVLLAIHNIDKQKIRWSTYWSTWWVSSLIRNCG